MKLLGFALAFLAAVAIGILVKVGKFPTLRTVHAAASAPTTVLFHEELGYGAEPGNGQSFISRRGLHAQRKDGARVSRDEQFTNTGKPYGTIRRIELPGGIEAQVEDSLRIVTAVKSASLAGRHLEQRFTAASDCGQRAGAIVQSALESRSGEQLVRGMRAVEFQSNDGFANTRTWRSPDAACFEVMRISLFKNHTGEATSWARIQPDAITLGDPEDSLFRVPDEYERVTFSEFYKRSVTAFGDKVDPSALKHLAGIDQHYEKIKFAGSLQN